MEVIFLKVWMRVIDMSFYDVGGVKIWVGC